MNPVKLLLILTLIWTSCVFPIAFAQAGRPAGQGPVPDQERRSSIHEVDGYAYLGGDKTLNQIKTEALSQAKRQALEEAGTYVSSVTDMQNFQVEFDRVWSKAEGMIRVLEQKDHGIENNRYHVWIKAEVIYGLKPRHEGAHPDALMDERAPLTVKVWTGKKTYHAGESVVVYVQGNRDFHARIVDITSTGDIVQLLPNKHRANDFFKAGKVYQVPDAGDGFDLRVSEPYGQDRIVVYAGESGLAEVALEPLSRGLGSFKGTKHELDVQSRGLKVVPGPGKGAGFYEAEWSFTTHP